MKKLLLIFIVTVLSLSVSAQHGYGSSRNYSRPHVVVRVARPIYPYYGYYDPFYSPSFFNNYGYYPRETRLERKINDIRSDYQDKIWSARHDKNLAKTERKATIHRLKHERDQAINEAKANYYKSR